MSDTVSIVPYFSGISEYSPEHTQQALNLRHEWFRYCLYSLNKISDPVFVGCCNEKDFKLLQPLAANNKIRILYFKGLEKAEFLPYVLVSKIQEAYDDNDKNNVKYVYYTEMDQILYAKDLDGVKKIIDKDYSVYFSPQRFEQIPKENVTKRKEKFSVGDERFVDFVGMFRENDNPYVVANEPFDIKDYDENYYVNLHTEDGLYNYDSEYYAGAYGAAYFCSSKLFLETEFLAIDYQPTEQIGGHCLFRTKNSKCLKSKDLFHFHVDHLSGYEFNKNL